MSRSLTVHQRLARLAGWAGAVCLLLQGCSQAPRAPQVSAVAPEPVVSPPTMVEPAPSRTGPVSSARTPGEYRHHAARHVYAQHAPHIYSGPMPPLLQAVGVLDIEIGADGEVRRLTWLRAPSHAPAVMRQIEDLIHRAAPYPAPLHLTSVTYTDTWLWHQSGRFQLHTLSEGQLGEVATSTPQEPKRRGAHRATTTPASTLSAKCRQPPEPPRQASAYC